MATLSEILLTEARRPLVVEDGEHLVESEVADKGGITGLAIKAAFKTVKAFKSGIIRSSVDALLDEFVKQLEPFYANHLAAGGGDFAAVVVAKGDEVAEALLAVTDARAERNKHKVLVGAYKKLRPLGKGQVLTALPRVGALLVKHGA